MESIALRRHRSPELNLLGLNELVELDRWALERRSRGLACTAFLGYQQTLCRVLGRYKLYLATTDVGFGAHVMLDGIWESWLTVFMARRVQPGMYVADAGANHGYYTLLFADLVGPDGRVAAIEPNPATASLLRRSLSVNGFDGRTEVHERALTDADGETLAFHMPTGEPKNARLVSATLQGHPEVQTVTSARLDTLLSHWPRLDFLKIDVEGAEEAMLSGAWGLIERHRPQMVLEYNASRASDGGALLDRLESVYGKIRWIDHESQLRGASRAELTDASNHEDWLLYLEP
ncbi:MAG TPA: FkbM family methyltransferase [Brevundimonas sp.]|uniref:FkbM family methyltransferase n=1 Tax=Brevundimonas sp. TaxID=1871086 RepID=UPI002E1488EB|nr:FkbM family methyltransferase [Brevundimonas sp.]